MQLAVSTEIKRSNKPFHRDVKMILILDICRRQKRIGAAGVLYHTFYVLFFCKKGYIMKILAGSKQRVDKYLVFFINSSQLRGYNFLFCRSTVAYLVTASLARILWVSSKKQSYSDCFLMVGPTRFELAYFG